MELIIREARGWRRKHCGEKSGRCQKRVPALKMVRRLFLLAILPIVASLEALRGREEGGRDLTCRWFWRRVKATEGVQTRTKNKRGRVKLAMFRGGGLGSYTALPFCLPMLYSRLLPPHGIWVSILAAHNMGHTLTRHYMGPKKLNCNLRNISSFACNYWNSATLAN